jgi:antitoxin VapB
MSSTENGHGAAMTKAKNVQTAKIFWTGRSQAVRLPKEFRFDTDEVRIRRHGSAVILESVADDWDWLDRLGGQLDEDAAKAAGEQPKQERPALDKLLRRCPDLRT